MGNEAGALDQAHQNIPLIVHWGNSSVNQNEWNSNVIAGTSGKETQLLPPNSNWGM